MKIKSPQLVSPTRGYIAVVSALILASILTALTVTESTSIFWARFSQVDQIHRIQSIAIASSCAYEALLLYAENSSSFSSATGATPIPVTIMIQPGVACSLEKIVTSGNTLPPDTVALYVQESVSGATVLLQILANTNASSTNMLSLVSWKEVTSVPP